MTTQFSYQKAVASPVFFKRYWELKQVENRRIPPMMDILFQMVRQDKEIPTQKEFVLSYMDSIDLPTIYSRVTKSKSNAHITLGQVRRGIIARAARSYPSLVRDLHLPIRLRELGYKAFYIKKYDIEYGIDIVLNYKDELYYIHCYVDSYRANYYRNIKDKRHPNTLKGKHLEAPMVIKRGDSNLYLYPDDAIDTIIKQIEAKDYKIFGNVVDTRRY